MEERKLAPNNEREALIKRLKRIEGQVKGIQKMVEQERYCVDILVQISAIRSAIESIKHDDADKTEEMIKELMDTINKFTK